MKGRRKVEKETRKGGKQEGRERGKKEKYFIICHVQYDHFQY